MTCAPSRSQSRSQSRHNQQFSLLSTLFLFRLFRVAEGKKNRLKKIFFFIASLSRNSFMTQCKHTKEENWNPPQKKRARREEKKCDDHKNETQKLQTSKRAKYAEHMFMSTNRPRHEISHFIFQFQCLNFLPRRERDWLRSVVIRERSCAAPLVDDMQMSLTNWSSRYTRSRCWRNGCRVR